MKAIDTECLMIYLMGSYWYEKTKLRWGLQVELQMSDGA